MFFYWIRKYEFKFQYISFIKVYLLSQKHLSWYNTDYEIRTNIYIPKTVNKFQRDQHL